MLDFVCPNNGNLDLRERLSTRLRILRYSELIMGKEYFQVLLMHELTIINTSCENYLSTSNDLYRTCVSIYSFVMGCASYARTQNNPDCPDDSVPR